jgi:hypothetical protein
MADFCQKPGNQGLLAPNLSTHKKTCPSKFLPSKFLSFTRVSLVTLVEREKRVEKPWG